MALIEELEPPSQSKKPNPKDSTLLKISLERLNQYYKKTIDFEEAFIKKAHFLLANLPKVNFGVVVDYLHSSKKVFSFFKKKYLSAKYLPHSALASIIIVGLVSNVYESNKALAISEALISVNPDTEYSIVESVGKYTDPYIVDDEILLDQSYQAKNLADGFVSNLASVSTELTQRTEPLPDNSSGQVKYVVRNGDTLSQLGSAFGVKIATLKYVNDMTNENLLKPGSELTIPTRGYEVPQSLIAQKEQQKRAQVLAQASRNTVIRNTVTQIERTGSSSGGLIVPIRHNGVSQGVRRGHIALDYRADIGTPVVAAASGNVITATFGWNGGYGTEVLITHANGLSTRYAHLSRLAVSSGQYVSQGQIIGYSGNTGRSTGPHLHFEKMINGRLVSPF